jgi:hypothetical protein
MLDHIPFTLEVGASLLTPLGLGFYWYFAPLVIHLHALIGGTVVRRLHEGLGINR